MKPTYCLLFVVLVACLFVCVEPAKRIKKNSSHKGSVCMLPKHVGRCRGSFQKYYFNHHTNDCDTFIYGGCGANANNFDSMEACRNACVTGNTEGLGAEQPTLYGGGQPTLYGEGQPGHLGVEKPTLYGEGKMAQYGAGKPTLYGQSDQVSVCMLPKHVGRCRGSFQKYYFNHHTSDCDTFIYGGCGANANNFDSMEACRNACVTGNTEQPTLYGDGQPGYLGDEKPTLYGEGQMTQDGAGKPTLYGQSDQVSVCMLPKHVGRCRGHFRKYFFNHHTNNCDTFIYGGCGGNANNFDSMETCRSACVAGNAEKPTLYGEGQPGNLSDEKPTLYGEGKMTHDGAGKPTLYGQSDQVSVCMLPKHVGRCRGSFQKYFFNHHTNDCDTFIYGGCGANANNFDSMEACRSACLTGGLEAEKPTLYGDGQQMAQDGAGKPTLYGQSNQVCMLPKETGRCMGFFRKYYFNHHTSDCDTFIYGGCGGNANSFDSLEACRSACVRQPTLYGDRKPTLYDPKQNKSNSLTSNSVIMLVLGVVVKLMHYLNQ